MPTTTAVRTGKPQPNSDAWNQLALALSTPEPEPERCPQCGETNIMRWKRTRVCAICFHEWTVKDA